MTALANFVEDELLDHILSTGAWAAPTNTYVKLHIGDPGEDCTGNPAATTTRQQITWAAAAARAIASGADLVWTAAASETISHISIWDDLTAGNPIAYGPLDTPEPVNLNDTFTIPTGTLTIDFTTIASALSTYGGNAALDHLTGRAAWTMPTAIYAQLHIGAPGLDGTGNVAATSTRQATGAFAASSGGASTNNGVISWTAAADETITHVTLWDDPTAGNNLLGGALAASKAITTGQTARFAAAALAVSLA